MSSYSCCRRGGGESRVRATGRGDHSRVYSRRVVLRHRTVRPQLGDDAHHAASRLRLQAAAEEPGDGEGGEASNGERHLPQLLGRAQEEHAGSREATTTHADDAEHKGGGSAAAEHHQVADETVGGVAHQRTRRSGGGHQYFVNRVVEIMFIYLCIVTHSLMSVTVDVLVRLQAPSPDASDRRKDSYRHQAAS